MITPKKESYENGVCRLEVYEMGGIWIGAGLAGLYMSPEEFADAWPLLKAYAEEAGLEKPSLSKRKDCTCLCHGFDDYKHTVACCEGKL